MRYAARIFFVSTLAGRSCAAGLLIHALFEQVEWLDDGPPLPERLAEATRRIVAATGEAGLSAGRAIEEFGGMLANQRIGDVLRRSFYFQLLEANGLPPGATELDVRNEFPFAVAQGGKLLSGSIDRLVLVKRDSRIVAADVIDFKTDNLGSDSQDLTARVAFYRPQIEAYRRAVADMARLEGKRVTARLMFVTAGVVTEI